MEDADEDLENDDEEISEDELSDDEDLGEDDDDDLSDMSFNSDEEQDEKSKTKRSKPFTSDSIFASAEEFASLLEDEGGSKIKPGSSNVVANRDNARKYIYYYYIQMFD